MMAQTAGDTGLLMLDDHEAEQIVRCREQEGWRVLRLDAGIASKEEFFESVKRSFPLDPMLHSNRSWDALADSLWAGIDGLPDERIVLLWPDASRMRDRAPRDFAIATGILADMPATLADGELTAGRTKRLLVLQETAVPDNP